MGMMWGNPILPIIHILPIKKNRPQFPEDGSGKNPMKSSQGLEFRLQLLLGDAGTDDLVLHFAVLEEQQ